LEWVRWGTAFDVWYRLTRGYLGDINEAIVHSSDDVFNRVVETANGILTGKININGIDINDEDTRVFLEFLAYKAPEIRELFRNPAPEVLSLVKDYILNVMRYSDPVSLDNVHSVRDYLSNLSVLDISYSHGFPDYNNSYLVLPPIDVDSSNIDSLVKELVSIYLHPDFVEYDSKQHVLKVLGYEVLKVSDESDFVTRVNSYLPEPVARKVRREIKDAYSSLIMETLKSIVPNSEIREVSDGIVMVDKISSIASGVGMSVPSDAGDKYVMVEVKIRPKKYMLSIVARLYDKQKGEPILKSLACKNEISLNINDFRMFFTASFVEAVDIFSKWMKLEKELIRLGYEFDGKDTYERETGFGTTRIHIKPVISGDKKSELRAKVRTISFDSAIYSSGNYVYLDLLKLDGLSSKLKFLSTHPDSRRSYLIKTGEIRINTNEDIDKFIRKLEQFERVVNISLQNKEVNRMPPVGDDLLLLYLVYLYYPTEFTFDFKESMKLIRTYLEALNVSSIKRIIKIFGAKELIYYLEDIITELLENGYIKVVNDEILVNNTIADFTRLGYSKEKANEIKTTVLRELSNLIKNTLIPNIDEIASIWSTLTPEQKEEYINSLKDKQLIGILQNDKLLILFKDSEDILKKRVLTSDNLVLKTLGVAKLMPNILGVKRVKITTTPGVPVIETPTFYVHIYDVKDTHVDYVLYGKKEKIGIIYRGKTLPEVIEKAVLRYTNDVRKTMNTTPNYITLKSLKILLMNPIIIDTENNEKETISN